MPIINIEQKEIQNKITYDDVIKEVITYTEKYELLDKKDSTKKLFSDIVSVRNYIPKCSSGLFRLLETDTEKIALITLQLK